MEGDLKRLRNQIGGEIITVIIASVIVILLILAVTNYISHQTRVDKKIQVSASCLSTANSVRDYLLKDEASLFVSSYGPTVGTSSYPEGVNINIDGVDQFKFENQILKSSERTPTLANAYLHLVNNASGVAQLSTVVVGLGDPSKWIFNNQMNIHNSMTRLLGIISQVNNVCCDSSNLNCSGAIVYDSTKKDDASNKLRGLFTSDSAKTEVRLYANAVENGNSVCSGGRLTKLPTAGGAAITFKVKIEVNGETCESTGRTSFAADTVPPATIVSLEQASINQLCQPSRDNQTPLICNGDVNQVNLNVWTVPMGDTACRRLVRSYAGQPIQCTGGMEHLPKDLYSNVQYAAACANSSSNSNLRTVSDPGSLFLCRIGEKNWFEANPNFWEPCESAKVYECSGGSGSSCTGRVATSAVVQISYYKTPNTKKTDYYSRARLTISNIPADRYIKYDVRAVDTAGVYAGQSYCNYANIGSSCSQEGYGFARLQSVPQVTSIVPDSGQIMTPRQHATANGVSDPEVLAAINAFPNLNIQCQYPGVRFQAYYTYANAVLPWIYTGFNAENAVLSAGLNYGCRDGVCNFMYMQPASEGNQTVSIQVRNTCGQIGGSQSYSWCVDRRDFTVSIPNLNNNPETYPPILSTTTPAKSCGLVYTYPTLSGGRNYVYNRNPNSRSDIGWNDSSHSGCLEQVSGYTSQLCIRVTDPCARVNDSNRERYQTTLARQPTVNSCISDGTTNPKDGNVCYSGLWCGIDNKCHDDSEYPFYNQDCSEISPQAPNVNLSEKACYDSTKIGQQDYIDDCNSQYFCDLDDDGNNSVDGWERLLTSQTGRTYNYSGANIIISSCSEASPPICSVTQPCDGDPDGAGAGTGTCRFIPTQSCNQICTMPGQCQVAVQNRCSQPNNNIHSGSGSGVLRCPDLNACSPVLCEWQRDLSQCLGACGTTAGKQNLTATCPCASCDGANPGLTNLDCEKYSFIGPDGRVCADWVEANRTACIGPCGSMGTQSINYECRNSSNVAVSTDQCPPTDYRPTEIVSCTKANPAVNQNGASCECYWQISPSSACVGECGFSEGTRNVTLTCAGGAGCTQPDGTCGGIPQPALTQVCTKDPDVGPTGGACGASPITCQFAGGRVLPGTGCGIPGSLPCEDIEVTNYRCSCATCAEVESSYDFMGTEFEFISHVGTINGIPDNNPAVSCSAMGNGCRCSLSGHVPNGGGAHGADYNYTVNFRFLCN